MVDIRFCKGCGHPPHRPGECRAFNRAEERCPCPRDSYERSEDVSEIVQLNESNLDNEVALSNVPVLVDFWAPWCPACVQLNPTIERLARRLGGQAKVCKLNADHARRLVAAYRISALPTVILFVPGRTQQGTTEATRVVGGRSEGHFLELLTRHAGVVTEPVDVEPDWACAASELPADKGDDGPDITTIP